ncbi:MAG TPA: LamG domain-containing protein, partial [Candidatus Acidoferrales bacterium]|nr:LamG domain-containing protein [Candidatus Acidoferrales bacterium]
MLRCSLLLMGMLLAAVWKPAIGQTTGLVAYWKLDQPAGATSFADSSGSGDTATCSSGSCPTMGTAGIIGTAADFIGGTQRVSPGDPANLNFGTGSFTYSLWVYVPSSIGAYDVAIWKGGGSANAPGFDMELGTHPWKANIADGSHIVQVGFGSGTYNQWILLTAVVNRSAGTLSAYRNGKLVSSASLGTFGSVSSSNTLYIGGISGYGFNGEIEEVEIYNTPLSASQVANLYSGATSSNVSVAITPGSVSLDGGQTQQFTATVTGSTNTAVTWSVSGGSISGSGSFIAPNVSGNYTITATSAANPAKSASASVSVSLISGTNRYLSTNGVDSGSCANVLSPCKTFSYVDSHAVSGDVVHVASGTYNLTSSSCIVTNTSGVTWQSDVHGAATINGGGNCLYMWHNSGSS